MTLVLRLRYKACAWKYELLPCAESSSMTRLKQFVDVKCTILKNLSIPTWSVAET